MRAPPTLGESSRTRTPQAMGTTRAPPPRGWGRRRAGIRGRGCKSPAHLLCSPAGRLIHSSVGRLIHSPVGRQICLFRSPAQLSYLGRARRAQSLLATGEIRRARVPGELLRAWVEWQGIERNSSVTPTRGGGAAGR
jgi:hypothetical protein